MFEDDQDAAAVESARITAAIKCIQRRQRALDAERLIPGIHEAWELDPDAPSGSVDHTLLEIRRKNEFQGVGSKVQPTPAVTREGVLARLWRLVRSL